MKPIIQMTEYMAGNPSLPKEFEGFRIVHISDFHNTDMGQNNQCFVDAIKAEHPDMIAITGDFLDARNPCIDTCLTLLSQLVEIAPCYFVPGNHEARMAALYNYMETKMQRMGVIVLRDALTEIHRNGYALYIAGVEDPYFEDNRQEMIAKTLHRKLEKILMPDAYTILLVHRPEPLWLYQRHNLSLVLAGHAHGGQIRLPVLGPIYAPNQGLFPRYTSGLYERNRTQMVVSRGIGNGHKVPRINNKAEIPIITLHSEQHDVCVNPAEFEF